MEVLQLTSFQRASMWALHLDHDAARETSDEIESEFSVHFFEALEENVTPIDESSAIRELHTNSILPPIQNDTDSFTDHVHHHDHESHPRTHTTGVNPSSASSHPLSVAWDRYVASELTPCEMCSVLLEAAVTSKSALSSSTSALAASDYESWAVGPMPLPIIHVVTRAFLDQFCVCLAGNDTGTAQTPTPSSSISAEALVVLAAVRLVLLSPHNHRAFLFSSRKVYPYIILDDVTTLNEPQSSPSLSPTLDILLRLCSTHVDAIVCLMSIVQGAMSRGVTPSSAQSSMERSPSLGSSYSPLQARRPTIPFHATVMDDAFLQQLRSSVWRRHVSEVEFTALLGVDSVRSSDKALGVAELCEVLSSWSSSKETRAAKAMRTDLCRRLAQLLLRYLPSHPLSLNLDEAKRDDSPATRQQEVDVVNGHRATITFLVSFLVQRLHSNDADIVETASSVLGDALVLLSRHSAAVEWGLREFAVSKSQESVLPPATPRSFSVGETSPASVSGDIQDQHVVTPRPGGNSERVVVPFLDHVAMFCSTVILSSCIRPSTSSEAREVDETSSDTPNAFGSPQRRRMVVDGIWASLKRIRSTSNAFVQFANHVDLQRLVILRQYQADLQEQNEDDDADASTEERRYDLTPTTDDDDDDSLPLPGGKNAAVRRRNAAAFAEVDGALRGRSENLHHIADALDRLDLTVCSFLSRLDEDAMVYGFRAWLDEEDANIRSHMRYVFAARGIHASVAEGTTSVSNPSTPTSSPSVAPRSPGLHVAMEQQQHVIHEPPRDFASVGQVIPITSALVVADLSLFSRCWCAHQGEDIDLDIVGTYRVWVTSGDFLTLLQRTILHDHAELDDIEPRRFASAAPYISNGSRGTSQQQRDGNFSGLSLHETHAVGPTPSPGNDGRSVVRSLRILIFSFIVSLSSATTSSGDSMTTWQRKHIETICDIIKQLIAPPSPSSTTATTARRPQASPRRPAASASTTEIVLRVTLCVQALMVMVRSLAAALSAKSSSEPYALVGDDDDTSVQNRTLNSSWTKSEGGDGTPLTRSSTTRHQLMRPELGLLLFDIQSSWHAFQQNVLPHAELIYGDYVMNRLRKAMVIIFRSSEMGQHLFSDLLASFPPSPSSHVPLSSAVPTPVEVRNTSFPTGAAAMATTPRTPMTTPRQTTTTRPASAAASLLTNVSVMKGATMQLLELVFYHHEGLLVSLVSSLSIKASSIARLRQQHQQMPSGTIDDNCAQRTLRAVIAGLLDLVNDKTFAIGSSKNTAAASVRLTSKNASLFSANFQSVNLHYRRLLKFINRLLSDPAPLVTFSSPQMPSFLAAPPSSAATFGLPPTATAGRGGTGAAGGGSSRTQLSETDVQRVCIVEALLAELQRTERLIERSIASAFAFGKAVVDENSKQTSSEHNSTNGTTTTTTTTRESASPPAAPAPQDALLSQKGQCAALLANAFQLLVLIREFAQLDEGDVQSTSATTSNDSCDSSASLRRCQWSRLAGNVQQFVCIQQPTMIASVIGWLGDIIVAQQSGTSSGASLPERIMSPAAATTPPRSSPSSTYHPHHRSLKKRHHRLKFMMDTLCFICHFHGDPAASTSIPGVPTNAEPVTGISCFGEIVLHLVTSLVTPANILLQMDEHQRQQERDDRAAGDTTSTVVVLPAATLAQWVADCVPVGPPRASSCLGRDVWEEFHSSSSSGAAALMELDEQLNVVVASMAVRLLRILMRCERSLELLSIRQLPPTSSLAAKCREDIESLRTVSKRTFFKIMRDRCTALVLREVLHTIALEESFRFASLSTATQSQNVGHEGSASSAASWMPVMDHVATSVRAALHASLHQPRRIVVFSVPRRHPGIITPAPKQFPSPDGFALSLWIRPTHVPSQLSVNGTMVLVGIHHRHAGGGGGSTKRQRQQAQSAAASSSSVYVTTLEVLLQRIETPIDTAPLRKRKNDDDDDSEGSPADTPGSLPTGKSTTSTMPPPSEEQQVWHHKSHSAFQRSPQQQKTRPSQLNATRDSVATQGADEREEEESIKYRVYIRCPEQQFTVGFPNGVVVVAPPSASHDDDGSNPITPTNQWRHVALSATYDTDHRVCNVILYIDGMPMGTASMTPPKFRPGGFVVLGGGSATSNRNKTQSVALGGGGGGEVYEEGSPFGASHHIQYQTSSSSSSVVECPELDAPFCGALGPSVLWRAHLTPEDVQFLWKTPNLDAVMDMPRFAHVRALQRGRCALQWLAGRMPVGASWWVVADADAAALSTHHHHRAEQQLSHTHGDMASARTGMMRHRHKRSLHGEFLVPNFFDIVNTLGGVSASLSPLLLCLTRGGTASDPSPQLPPSSPATAFLVPLRSILLTLTAASTTTTGATAAGYVSTQCSTVVSPLSPFHHATLMTTTAPSQQFPSTLPNLLAVVLACVARSPVDEGLAVMKIVSLVLPALPKGMVSAAVVEPLRTLLSETCVDGGHRSLFHAVLHDIILNFTLWDRCSPVTQNELCMLFLEVLRKDAAVLEAASRDCARTVIPLLLQSVQTTLSGLHHKALRKARVTAMYTAASMVPTEQTIIAGIPSSMPNPPRGAAQKKKYIDEYYDWIALSYVMLGQHALDDTLSPPAAAAGMRSSKATNTTTTASASPSSMRSQPFPHPFSSSVSVASLAALQRHGTSSLDDLINATRRITPSHLPPMLGHHATFLYEVLLGTLELCRRLDRDGMQSAIQALVRAGLADVLATAMARGSKSVHVTRTALATLSILLRGTPTSRLPILIRGKHYQLFHKTANAFALAPLLGLLPFWDPSHPPLTAALAIAILELSEGDSRRWTDNKSPREGLFCFAEGLTAAQLAATAKRPAWAGAISTSELAPSLQNPAVLPLLVEVLCDHMEAHLHHHQQSAGAYSGTTTNTSMTSSSVAHVQLQLHPDTDAIAWRIVIRDVLEAIAVCIASRDGAAAADMLLNPVTLHSLARIYAHESHQHRSKATAGGSSPEVAAVDKQRIPQILGLCCGRVLASLPETSWILLWHVVLSLMDASRAPEQHCTPSTSAASPPQNTSMASQLSHSTTTTSSSASSHGGGGDDGPATAALMIQWTASEMQLVWFGIDEVIRVGSPSLGRGSRGTFSSPMPRSATAAPVVTTTPLSSSPSPRHDAIHEGNRSISPRRSVRVSPPTGSKPAAARIAQRMIPLCYMADVLVAQPYLYQDVIADEDEKGSACFAACLSILSLVHHDKEVLQAFLRSDCASAIVDEAESVAFGVLLEARSTLTILSNIARCALVTLREQPHRLLEEALLPLKTVLTDSFTKAAHQSRVSSTSSNTQARGINASSPPLRFITHTITQILLFSCEERRRASSMVFARDQGSIPPCAAMLLGEVCVTLSLNPFNSGAHHRHSTGSNVSSSSRHHLNYASDEDPTWHLNDADLKELCRVLHRGLGLFWEPVQRLLGRSANSESSLASWVSKSKVDVQYFFSSIVRSDIWESLQRLFAVAAGDTLHVSRNACPVEVVVRVQEAFNRQRRIEQEIWSQLTPSRGIIEPASSSALLDEGPPLFLTSPTTNNASLLPQEPAESRLPTSLELHSKLLPTLNIPSLQTREGAAAVAGVVRPPSSSGQREKVSLKLSPAIETLFQTLLRRIRRTGGPFDCWTRSATTNHLTSAAAVDGGTAANAATQGGESSHHHPPASSSLMRRCLRHRGLREVSWENYCPTVSVFLLPESIASSSSKHTASKLTGRTSVRMSRPTHSNSIQPTPRSLCTPRPSTARGGGGASTFDQIRDLSNHASLINGHEEASTQWAASDSETRRDVGVVLVHMEVEIVFGLVAWPAQLYLTSAGYLVVRTVFHHDDAALGDGDHFASCASLGGTATIGGGIAQAFEDSDEESEAAQWYDQELLSSLSTDHNGLLAGMRPRSFMWHLSEVRDCSPGFRLRMRRTAMLLRHQHGEVVLLNFVDEAAAEDASHLIAHRTLLGRSPPEQLASAHRTQRRWSVLEGAQQQQPQQQQDTFPMSAADQRYSEAAALAQLWTRGSMTNFEYLMRLNTLAGRSVQDLSQYPIFPIILADYHSSALDLTNPASFRDLRWPVGAQTDRQRGNLQTRFTEMRAVLSKQREDAEHAAATASDDDVDYDHEVRMHALQQPYHNAALYSSPSSVLHLLVRMEPYTSLHRALHDGRFDLPDRCFTTTARLYEHGSFEAVPEMFYMPDVYLSDFRTATEIDDVQLPPWAQGSPWRFVAAQRVALESAYVTERLPQWIDLIFGFRQFGISAVERLNTFHPMLGESWVDANMSPKRCHDTPAQPKLEDRDDRHEYDEIATLARGMWENMGQLPMQLFTTPHPTPSWATSNQTQQSVAQQRLRQHQQKVNPFEQLTRRLRGPTSLIESIARGFDLSSPLHQRQKVTPQRSVGGGGTSDASISVAPAARIVVDYLPHASGKLFILLDNGCVAVTSWKGIPTTVGVGVGSSLNNTSSSTDLAAVMQDAQFFGSCAPDDAMPLCLINATGTHYDVPNAASSSHHHHHHHSNGPQLVEGRYPVHVLYTSRRRRHVLILASLTCADGGTLYASNTLEAVVPIPILTEDCTPGTEAAVVRAVGIHCAERDVFGYGVPVGTSSHVFGSSPTDYDEMGGAALRSNANGISSSTSSNTTVDIIAVSQSDGALTLWKCGEANTAHAGLTCMGALVGHACAVVATDINVIADLCVSVSRSATPLSPDSSSFAHQRGGGWRVLLHTISTKECIAELPILPPSTTTTAATTQRSSSGSSSSNNNTNTDNTLPPSIAVLHAPYPLVLVSTQSGVYGFHPSSGLLLFHQPPASYGICRLMIRRVVDLTVLLASANVTTVFREWDQESIQEAIVSRLHPRERKAGAGAVPASRNSTPREGSPTTTTTSGGGPIARRQTTTNSVLPSVSEREVAVLSTSVVLDVRSRATVGPSAIRAIGVSLLSNGTFTLFV